MPSAVRYSRRRRDDDSDDEGDNDIYDASSSHGSASKRTRLNLNGDASPSNRGHQPQSNGSLQRETSQPRVSHREHQPGSIVRVKLADFVTYTAVEFFPGPSLNMVIGPNGTGKSTLVCAICLGLGWGPQHLGRAKEVSEFVKHGCQEAWIEIELKREPKKEKNPVIRCNIKREGNKTTFSIDGKPANKKAVLELARGFSIQIDNLCQFLPQDKVVEFAAMTPIELLRSTQRAVATQEMQDQHEELKELRKKQKEVQASGAANEDTLANLESRQRMQEADVERMRERDKIKEHVKYLELTRPFAEYRGARLRHQEAKERRKQADTELKKLEKEVAPTLEAVNQKQEYRGQIDVVARERKRAVERAEQVANNVITRHKDLEEHIKEIDHKKTAERESTRKDRSDIARIKGIIASLKRQMEESPPDIDMAAFNERIREKEREGRAHFAKIGDLKTHQEEIIRQGRENNGRIEQAKRDLANLESQAGQQSRKLEEASPDTYRAWQWIQNHQDDFQKPILGPPMVTCSVQDPRYVEALETIVQKSEMIAFTAQTQADFEKLGEICERKLHLAEVNIRTMSGSLAEFSPPIDEEEMKHYGFDGWAIDHLTGPEPVRAMLCYSSRLHITGIAAKDVSEQQFELLQQSNVNSWISGKSMYQITRRREYGPGAVSTRVRDIKGSGVWSDQPVDTAAKRDLQENIEGWESELTSFKQRVKEMGEEVDRSKEKIREAREERDALSKEKNEKQAALTNFRALPTKLAQQEEKLATVDEAMAGFRRRLLDLEGQHDCRTMEKGRLALDYAKSVHILREAHSSLHEAEIMLIEATSEVETLSARNRAVKELLESKNAELNEIAAETTRLQAEARRVLLKCQEIMAERATNPVLDQFLTDLSTDLTLEEVDSEIEGERARLELMHEGNGGVIREYEQRQKRIDQLKSLLEDTRHATTELDEKITEIRHQWEPELDRLVKKISNSFSFNMKQINCAGEVSVFKDEQDFDEWAIHIQVKFRETESLTTLDSHRQSGGERAVSTIFYLMSLQSLTRSPFRVVDEINQGMDPRNERLVHKRMVQIACGNVSHPANTDGEASTNPGEEEGGGSQYFLITPKLLHGLVYERGMRVLCIASGEYMPEDRSLVDFGRCVGVKKGLGALGRARGIAVEA